MRIGMGFDVHRLVAGRPLVIGGVTIPFEKGVLGHSDGDVLIHAVCDALLGAAGLGDIGEHFPDTDPRFKDVASVIFLAAIRDELKKKRWEILSIDSVVLLQRPKIAPYKAQMVTTMAKALCISPDRLNVKATTEEGMGYTGTGEGVSAQAIALLGAGS